MKKTLRITTVLMLAANLILFLGLAYINMLRPGDSPRADIYIDFWGRWTVYSLWFFCYEGYKRFLVA